MKKWGGIEQFNQIVDADSKIATLALDVLNENETQIFLEDPQDKARVAPQMLCLTFLAQKKVAKSIDRNEGAFG